MRQHDRNIFFSCFSTNVTFDINQVQVDLVVVGYSQIHVTSKEFSRVIYYYLSLHQRREREACIYEERHVHTKGETEYRLLNLSNKVYLHAYTCHESGIKTEYF